MSPVPVLTIFGLTAISAVASLQTSAASQSAARAVLWSDPGAVETLDLASGAGGKDGAPAPPFVFSEGESGGTSPKLLLQDAKGALWSVKFGKEARPEVFASRLVWALGYFVEPSWFVAEGRIGSVGKISGAAEDAINRSDGNSFKEARFELRDPHLRFQGDSWNFVNNPFVGTKELNGLKVLMMMLSNWDVKDSRSSHGPNTAILLSESSDRPPERRYMVIDWGATMGKWGNIVSRTRWNCDAFADQTPQFVTGTKNGIVGFGFSGKHTSDMTDGIRVSDVSWLMQYLGRITDAQLRDALQSSGANAHEVECFTRSLRSRIEQLRQVSR